MLERANAGKGSTRGKSNTKTIKKEDASLVDARTNHEESKKLTEETLELKGQYDKHHLTLSAAIKTVKHFLIKYGRSIEMKSLIDEDGSISIFRVDKTKINDFWYAFNYCYDDKPDREVSYVEKVRKLVRIPGTFADSIETVYEDKTITYNLKEVRAEFNQGNFTRLFELVKKAKIQFNKTPGGEEGKKLNEGRSLLLEMQSCRSQEEFTKLLLKEVIINAAAQNEITISQFTGAIATVIEAFAIRDLEMNAIYQMSSDQVIAALETGTLKCSVEDVESNNSALLNIAGIESDAQAPIQISSDSDFIYHKEHFDRQCELSGNLRVTKSEMYARYISFFNNLHKTCAAETTQERNENYDKNQNTDSTALAIFTTQKKEQSCDSLKKSVDIFLHNIELFYSYATSDDASIAEALEKSKVYYSVDRDGYLNIEGVSTAAKSTIEASSFMNFEAIEDALPTNPNAIKLAIDGGNYNEEPSSFSFVRENSSDLTGQPAAEPVAPLEV